MSDDPAPAAGGPDPELTPEHEARLRRLLASARPTEPVPADVVQRLDRVLAQLATQGIDAPDLAPSAGVSDLAARRRRRVQRLLVAAAAVVVVGVGVGQLVQHDGGTGGGAADSATAGSSSPDRATARGDLDSGPEAFAQSTPEGQQEPLEDGLTSSGDEAAGSSARSGPRPPVVLTEQGFARQVARLRTTRAIPSRPGATIPPAALSRDVGFACDPADWGAGRLLAASYDGVPTVLVYRPVRGETQTAELLRCGTAEVVRSTVLPLGR